MVIWQVRRRGIVSCDCAMELLREERLCFVLEGMLRERGFVAGKEDLAEA
jgi:hypothetical protein